MAIPEEQLYRQAIAKYGEDLQMTIAHEECAELIKAISKYKRKDSDGKIRLGAPDSVFRKEQLVEEIADVQIMLDQLKLIHCEPAEFAAVLKAKQERLAGRLGVPVRDVRT